MKRLSLRCIPRETEKSEVKRLRRTGYVPGILYGHGVTPLPLAVPENDLRRLLKEEGGSSGIIDLYPGDGEPRTVILRDVDRDPVRRRIIHVDFQQVSMTEEIEATVPIVVVGDEAIAKKGLLVQHQAHELEVKCLPEKIPEHFTVDVSGMSVGNLVRAMDIQVPEGVKVLVDPDEVILSIVAPKRVEEEEEAEAAPAGTEPAEANKEEE